MLGRMGPDRVEEELPIIQGTLMRATRRDVS
jgi:hypothetical protein